MSATPKKAQAVPCYLQELAQSLPPLLTIQEAADTLRVHLRTMQRIVADEEVAAMRSKRAGASRVIIPRSEIIRWLVEHPAR